MTQENFDPLQIADTPRLRMLWSRAGVRLTATAGPEKAPAFGVNFRIDLLEALQATWETTKVALKTGVSLHVPFDPLAWLEISVETFSAIRSIVSSLVETMPPINYIIYVMLSEKPDGMPEIDLKRSVQDFLVNPASLQFAWYLGMTAARIQRAIEVTALPPWFDTALDQLEEKSMIERRDGLLLFKSRNFTIGWESD